jgi:RNA polymerase sigma factor (TIGR02999 family)
MVGNVTEILSQVGLNDQSSQRLFPLVYCELRRLAAAHLRAEKSGHTLQPTALVHEVYLRLLRHDSGADGESWNSRAHFFAAAAVAMRRILVDNARRKRRIKRGGEKARVAVDLANLPSQASPVDVLEISDALSELEL